MAVFAIVLFLNFTWCDEGWLISTLDSLCLRSCQTRSALHQGGWDIMQQFCCNVSWVASFQITGSLCISCEPFCSEHQALSVLCRMRGIPTVWSSPKLIFGVLDSDILFPPLLTPIWKDNTNCTLGSYDNYSLSLSSGRNHISKVVPQLGSQTCMRHQQFQTTYENVIQCSENHIQTHKKLWMTDSHHSALDYMGI